MVDMEKSGTGTGLITSVTVFVCVPVEAVPVTVSVYVPVAAVPEFTDKVELPPAVTLVGENDAVAPEGTPETLRLIEPAKPFRPAVLVV